MRLSNDRISTKSTLGAAGRLAGVALFAALQVALPAADADVPAKPAQPNIIFILADDLGYGDLGCYGQQRISTPHLDRLATEGLRCTSAYAGAAVCGPSRCALITGLHTGHARIRGNGTGNGGVPATGGALQEGDDTVSALLHAAGYRTGMVGKWGLGDVGMYETGLPRRHGFDYFFGYLNQRHAHNSYPSFLWRNEEKVPLANVVPNEDASGAGVSTNKAVFSEDLFIDEAERFIRSSRQPFFLYFTPTLPHANNESKPLGLEVDAASLARYTDRDWPLVEKTFAAMVTRLDADVGRLLDLLHELHLDENTIVIFASDNGPHREGGHDPAFFQSSGPLRGIKRDLYDGGLRVPLIVRWPGRVAPGRVDETPVYFPDFMPTLAAVAHADAPRHTDGVDLLPFFQGRPQPELAKRTPYWESYERGLQCAVRFGKWKGVRKKTGGPVELYDLETDLAEKHDISADHPDIVATLQEIFQSSHVSSKEWDALGEVRTKTPLE